MEVGVNSKGRGPSYALLLTLLRYVHTLVHPIPLPPLHKCQCLQLGPRSPSDSVVRSRGHLHAASPSSSPCHLGSQGCPPSVRRWPAIKPLLWPLALVQPPVVPLHFFLRVVQSPVCPPLHNSIRELGPCAPPRPPPRTPCPAFDRISRALPSAAAGLLD